MIGLFVIGLAWGGTWDRVRAARDDAAAVHGALEVRIAVAELATDVARYAVQGREPPALDARAGAAGLAVAREGDLLFLHGDGGVGAGLLAVRLGDRVDDLVLVAPHGWADVSTGPLVAQWFDEGFGRIALFNTVHRTRGPDAPPGGSEADVAHRPDSLFQALLLGVTDGLVDPLVVEVHGYADRRFPFAAVVADGGTLQPPALAADVAGLLEAQVEGPVGLGPDVWRLAATKNVQGHALSGRVRFVHVELSRDVRRGLRRDPVRRAAVGAGLVRLAGGR